MPFRKSKAKKCWIMVWKGLDGLYGLKILLIQQSQNTISLSYFCSHLLYVFHLIENSLHLFEILYRYIEFISDLFVLMHKRKFCTAPETNTTPLGWCLPLYLDINYEEIYRERTYVLLEDSKDWVSHFQSDSKACGTKIRNYSKCWIWIEMQCKSHSLRVVAINIWVSFINFSTKYSPKMWTNYSAFKCILVAEYIKEIFCIMFQFICRWLYQFEWLIEIDRSIC